MSGRPDELLRHFDALHRDGEEPWAFSERGVETLRHERVAALVSSLAPRRVLELGCSLGLMTARLAALPAELWAMDLSPTAVRRARAGLRDPLAGVTRAPTFVAGSATLLPVAPRSFDVVVASDGLYSWHLPPEARAAALREIHDALAPGGHVVLTEHMRPARFAEFVAEVRASPLRVASVTYLHDRPCYQFEGWLKAVRHWRVARALRRSTPLARALSTLGRPVGAAGSRHICVVAARDA
jgi:SAM-dependent methyltransferase